MTTLITQDRDRSTAVAAYAKVQADHAEAADVAAAWVRLIKDATGIDVSRRGRAKPVAGLRQCLMLALVDDGHSLPAIAKAGIGISHHTTVMHGARVARRSALMVAIARAIVEADEEMIHGWATA